MKDKMKKEPEELCLNLLLLQETWESLDQEEAIFGESFFKGVSGKEKSRLKKALALDGVVLENIRGEQAVRLWRKETPPEKKRPYHPFFGTIQIEEDEPEKDENGERTETKKKRRVVFVFEPGDNNQVAVRILNLG